MRNINDMTVQTSLSSGPEDTRTALISPTGATTNGNGIPEIKQIYGSGEQEIKSEEDDDDDDDDNYVEKYSIGHKRPGPRRRSCPWCSNRKCSHCRCEGFSRCDHSNNEPCKRVRYYIHIYTYVIVL